MAKRSNAVLPARGKRGDEDQPASQAVSQLVSQSVSRGSLTVEEHLSPLVQREVEGEEEEEEEVVEEESVGTKTIDPVLHHSPHSL